jgi:hypothetical protein
MNSIEDAGGIRRSSERLKYLKSQEDYSEVYWQSVAKQCFEANRKSEQNPVKEKKGGIMKIRWLGSLVVVIAALSLGELSYAISDTPPQVRDTNNPSWNTPRRSGPLRPVKMPYGEIQDPRDWRTVYPDSGPGVAQGSSAKPNGIEKLKRQGVIHRGKWH